MKAIGVDTETSTSETVNFIVTVDSGGTSPVFLLTDGNAGLAIDHTGIANEGDVYVFDVSTGGSQLCSGMMLQGHRLLQA